MGDATVVGRGLHAVVGAQRFVTRGQILARLGFKIAERRRQAVGAVFARHASECPDGVYMDAARLQRTPRGLT